MLTRYKSRIQGSTSQDVDVGGITQSKRRRQNKRTDDGPKNTSCAEKVVLPPVSVSTTGEGLVSEKIERQSEKTDCKPEIGSVVNTIRRKREDESIKRKLNIGRAGDRYNNRDNININAISAKSTQFEKKLSKESHTGECSRKRAATSSCAFCPSEDSKAMQNLNKKRKVEDFDSINKQTFKSEDGIDERSEFTEYIESLPKNFHDDKKIDKENNDVQADISTIVPHPEVPKKKKKTKKSKKNKKQLTEDIVNDVVAIRRKKAQSFNKEFCDGTVENNDKQPDTNLDDNSTFDVEKDEEPTYCPNDDVLQQHTKDSKGSDCDDSRNGNHEKCDDQAYISTTNHYPGIPKNKKKIKKSKKSKESANKSTGDIANDDVAIRKKEANSHDEKNRDGILESTHDGFDLTKCKKKKSIGEIINEAQKESQELTGYSMISNQKMTENQKNDITITYTERETYTAETVRTLDGITSQTGSHCRRNMEKGNTTKAKREKKKKVGKPGSTKQENGEELNESIISVNMESTKPESNLSTNEPNKTFKEYLNTSQVNGIEKSKKNKKQSTEDIVNDDVAIRRKKAQLFNNEFCDGTVENNDKHPDTNLDDNSTFGVEKDEEPTYCPNDDVLQQHTKDSKGSDCDDSRKGNHEKCDDQAYISTTNHYPGIPKKKKKIKKSKKSKKSANKSTEDIANDDVAIRKKEANSHDEENRDGILESTHDGYDLTKSKKKKSIGEIINEAQKESEELTGHSMISNQKMTENQKNDITMTYTERETYTAETVRTLDGITSQTGSHCRRNMEKGNTTKAKREKKKKVGKPGSTKQENGEELNESIISVNMESTKPESNLSTNEPNKTFKEYLNTSQVNGIEKSKKRKVKKEKKRKHQKQSSSSEGEEGFSQSSLHDLNNESKESLPDEDFPTLDSENRGTYSFTIEPDAWMSIQPRSKTYGGKIRREVRRMSGDWTNVFSMEIKRTHPGCTLSFKSHNIKKKGSRKMSSPFMAAIAYCKGDCCLGKFAFRIDNDPGPNEEVPVHYTVSGTITHHFSEVNRRNITGEGRIEMGEEIQKSSPAAVFYKNYNQADPSQLEQGNYSSVPNPAVLRKIVSEIVKKENLHANVMTELQILKEAYNSDQYIQEIGLDPFTIILFSKGQLKLIKQMSIANTLSVYIDSTGSVINAIKEQKRPYLYSIVVKPNMDLPAVSICDMITTQHTIPRIELLLATVKRAVAQEGTKMNISKVETDFSLAIIQACLRQFTNKSLKSYLANCYSICTERDMSNAMTCLHICSAHSTNNFVRYLKKKQPSANKLIRKVALCSFAALVNSISLEEARQIYDDICTLFLSRQATESVKAARDRITSLKAQELNDDEFQTDCTPVDEDTAEEMTIKDGSPFTAFFSSVRLAAKNTSEETNQPNDLFSPGIIDIFENHFLPTFPLWSGVILSGIQSGEDGVLTRDTNEPVENWFKFLKHDLKMIHMRPAKFVIKLRGAVEGRLKENNFQGGRKKKTKTKEGGKINENARLETKEEMWRKRGKQKSKPKYHQPEKMKNISEKLPTVMQWGGTQENIHLSNTCSIDNLLTSLHIYALQHPGFLEKLHLHQDKVLQNLENVVMLMKDHDFASAKLMWADILDHRIKKVTDFYGDEYDYSFRVIGKSLTSKETSICDQMDCYSPVEESREETGVITCGIEEEFTSIQYLINVWQEKTTPCGRQNQDLSDFQDGNIVCMGRRHIRRLVNVPPIVVVRLYEHALFSRISTHNILKSKQIRVQGCELELAGVTFHKEDHYCAVVVYKGCDFWYDGLVGRLCNLPKDINTWFASHAIFCLK